MIQSDKFWVRGYAVSCLEAFPDGESISAPIASFLDEGGHDFDNAGSAAKLLAISLIESCLTRPYVAGDSDGEEWREVVAAIKKP